MTSTSPIRGTLRSVDSSSLKRHAAISGRAAFLLPSTSMRPESWSTAFDNQCGHELVSLDRRLELPHIHNLIPQLDAEPLAHARPASFDERPDVGGRRAAFVHDEVAVRRRDACAAN